ncbi:MAG: ABC transporter permease subunit [Sellimonas intestinalis]
MLTARSKGTSRYRILTRHVLKNCLLPIITLVGINLAGLVCGSFVIESVFSWPGIGRLAMDAVNSRDYPLIMGFTDVLLYNPDSGKFSGGHPVCSSGSEN